MSKAAKRRAEVDRRLAESRSKLRRRVAEVGDEVEREAERARMIKDGFVAVLGVVGLLVSFKRLNRGRKRKKVAEKSAGGEREKKA